MRGIVYILTNSTNTVLYIGVTSDIINRLKKHREKTYEKSFTAKYNICKLVYYEFFETIGEAIKREKQLKAGSRAKKISLVNKMNPGWEDLSSPGGGQEWT
jgi:putative endonuclease